ncbi:peptidyl-prolyl cis-trans isomerase [Rubritalea tangerina]|uniref:Peptidyl-prolyl cis-trans isomerase n=2 Tax=Rubritalea tangerina TaxID=430798 RepID=A0ABW4ZBB1_9BACT
MKKIWNEPWFGYLIIGAMLYGIVEWRAGGEVEKERIEVRPELVKAYLKRDEELSGRKSTEEDRSRTIESIIDEEVLLREAYAAGYDRTDPRVRKRLLTLMRSAITPVVADPSITQLQEYYQKKKSEYRSQVSYDYEHVYFSHVSEKLPEDSEGFLDTLDGVDRAAALGDPYAYGHLFKGQERERVAMYFGAEMAEGVETHAVGEWFGPVRSRVGQHYVRVLNVIEAREPLFEEVEGYMREAWRFEQIEKKQDEALLALREKYQIVSPD